MSTDDHPERVPADDLGPRLLSQRVSQTARKLHRMKHLLIAGGYDDDLPPRYRVGDPGDQTGWDPASAGSA